ncbi:MAG: inositol monophosphatase [Gammaproteobacteria bacterium]|nr:MAG: inositol monophosphatase [Gammaproteobacteria bacterium]
MHPMLNIAVRAARRAGDIISRSMDKLDSIDVVTKDHNDFVSAVDEAAEATIIQIIKTAYPDHQIIAEESGNQGDSDYVWIIDPLDGTTNFLHGFPQFAVSIALKHQGKLQQAVIYDPVSQELFTASRGAGAQLNSRRIRVSKRKELAGSLIGTGFPFRKDQNLDTYLDTFRAIAPKTAGIRRAGSAALDLAYVAAGRLDGFWEFGLKPWDIAAGVLLIEEAGGLVGDMSGGSSHMDSGDLVCGNPKVFKALLQTIRPHLG